MKVRLRICCVSLIWSLFLIFANTGCSVDSANNHYFLGERLWSDQKYGAAISEFEKVIAKDPRGKLGQQALFRAATTQFLFLSQYGDAIRKFKSFVSISGDPRLIWDAQLQIGEILFSKTEQYDQVINHYRLLLNEKPNAVEAPELLFRIGKSLFFLFRFDEAIETYQALIKKYPMSHVAEKASYEIGVTYLTRGSESYEQAKEAYLKFIQKYPKSNLVSDAQFGIASSLEEQDQLEDALNGFIALKRTYASPAVIDVKLNRIRQRIAQRHASR